MEIELLEKLLSSSVSPWLLMAAVLGILWRKPLFELLSSPSKTEIVFTKMVDLFQDNLKYFAKLNSEVERVRELTEQSLDVQRDTYREIAIMRDKLKRD